MNLNQNDLIEVLMEDLKEDLEKKILDNEKELEAVQLKQKEFGKGIQAKLVEIASGNKIYKAVTELAKSLKFPCYSEGNYGTEPFCKRESKDAKEGIDYWDFRFATLENFRNMDLRGSRLTYYGSNYCIRRLRLVQGKVTLRSYQNGEEFTAVISVDDKAISKEFLKINDLVKEEARLLTIHHELLMELHKATSGEKRFKARFIKASLGKTKEGKQILSMMNSVKGGMKLLS
jgi:hypothetical protein